MNAQTTIGQFIGAKAIQICSSEGVMVNTNAMDFSSSYVVGVEVELENTQDLAVDFWQSTADSSLRNNGVEYVSVPFHINKAETVVGALTNALPTNAIASGRCGLHVHLNCLDLSISNLRRLLQRVYDNEERLFARSGNRQENLFCVPWHGSVEEPYLLRFLNGDNDLVSLVHRCKKYAGINLCPLIQRGTLEFRMHKGSKSAEEILSWVNYLVNFKRYVLET